MNRGKADGLLPGMELYHAEFPDVRVLDVSASSYRAKASDWLLEEEPADMVRAKEPRVRLGLRYSTRAPDSTELP